MSIRAPWVLVVAAVGVVVGSCTPPKSKHPLSDPRAAVADARLVGVWAGRVDDDEVTISFFPTEGASFDLVLVGAEGKKGAAVLAFTGFPSNVGGKTYWNLRAKSFGADYGEPVKVDDSYIFARYAVGADNTLTIWVMDDAAARAAVEAGALEGKRAGNDTLLTASSEKLAAFLASAEGEKSFKAPLAIFKRVKIEPAKPAGKPAKAK